MFFSILYVQYITNVFKSFGESNGLHDQFLTYANSVGLVLNCVSRLMGGFLLDYINFKPFFAVTLALSGTLSLTYSYVAYN